MRTRTYIIAGLVLAAGIAAWLIVREPLARPEPTSAAVSAPPGVSALAAAVEAPLPPPEAEEPIASAANDSSPEPGTSTEPLATARMYAAHAPLRAPAVSDPDSEANRRVLEAMVSKALASRGAELP